MGFLEKWGPEMIFLRSVVPNLDIWKKARTNQRDLKACTLEVQIFHDFLLTEELKTKETYLCIPSVQ